MRVVHTLALALSLVICFLFAFSPAYAQLDVAISIDVEPPPLPVYDQPPIPEPGYLWVPGYWAWDDDTGYYCSNPAAAVAGARCVMVLAEPCAQK